MGANSVQAPAAGQDWDASRYAAHARFVAELGVGAIQPISAERSIVRLSGERALRRTEHWRNLVIAACEQCGRNRVPEVATPIRLQDWLGQLADRSAPGRGTTTAAIRSPSWRVLRASAAMPEASARYLTESSILANENGFRAGPGSRVDFRALLSDSAC